MSSARYQRLATSDDAEPSSRQELEDGRYRIRNVQAQAPVVVDPRFHEPTPSPWARAALLLFTAFLFWLAFSMRHTTWLAMFTE